MMLMILTTEITSIYIHITPYREPFLSPKAEENGTKSFKATLTAIEGLSLFPAKDIKRLNRLWNRSSKLKRVTNNDNKRKEIGINNSPI